MEIKISHKKRNSYTNWKVVYDSHTIQSTTSYQKTFKLNDIGHFKKNTLVKQKK